MLRIGVIMYQTSLTKGQELVAQRMVREFRRQGHDAFLITSVYQDSEQMVSPDDIKRRGGYIHAFDSNLGIPVIRVVSDNTTWPPRRISFTDFVGVLTGIVDDLKLNVLITHSTLWNGPEEVVKFVAWKRKMAQGGGPRSPLVFCHMSHFQEPNDERYALVERSYREAWNNVILPQVLGAADLILVTTPYEANFMKRLGAKDERLFLFPGGIEDEDIMSLGRTDLVRSKYGLPAEAKLVSFLGTVEERKNPRALLEVARLLAKRGDIRIVIAGRLEGEYGAALNKEAAGLPNVSVLGPVSESEKAALIRTSFANITMSRSEALGVAQLEFMSAGVPVITSGVGGQSWIVGGGSNGVVLGGPDDAQGAADAISRLADDPELRRKMSRMASRTASTYSLTRLIDKLSNRLEEEVRSHSDDISAIGDMQEDERVIEAWVHKGKKVAATSRRLIVRSAKSGREVTTILYDDIAKIERHAEAPWAVLALGAAATALLLGQRMAGLQLLRFIVQPLSEALQAVGFAGTQQAAVTALPFVPVAVAAVAFLSAVKRGYVVHYGSSRTLFLPGKFVKALRLADKLTPRELFGADADK